MLYKKYVSFSRENDCDYYSHKEISKSDVEPNWLLADYNYVQKIIRQISGKVLTIIDASISDKQQNKAVKDLIKDRISDIFIGVSAELTPMSDKRIDEIMKDNIPVGVSADELLEDK